MTVGDEATLLEALRRGEAASQESFVRLNAGRMLAVARRMLRSEEDAQDAVQDAFLQAFRALPEFEGGARLSTWLHRIVVNACLMKLRHRRRHPEASIEDLLPTFDSTGHREAVAGPWPEDALESLAADQTRKLVRETIDRLPPSYRDVIVLRDIEGLSTEETARTLGIRPEATKMRLHRARQALRTLLDPHFAERT
jgi:RNA polymerase sigma-70 factor (ECF subfamily)